MTTGTMSLVRDGTSVSACVRRRIEKLAASGSASSASRARSISAMSCASWSCGHGLAMGAITGAATASAGSSGRTSPFIAADVSAIAVAAHALTHSYPVSLCSRPMTRSSLPCMGRRKRNAARRLSFVNLNCGGLSDGNPRILLGHDHLHLLPLQFRDELVRSLLDDRERAVVARDHGLGLDEALDRDCGRDRAHGEAVADRNYGNLRLMDFGDQRHVGEDVGIAEVPHRRLAPRLDDHAARIAEIDRHAVLDVARGVVGP